MALSGRDAGSAPWRHGKAREQRGRLSALSVCVRQKIGFLQKWQRIAEE